MAVVSLEELEKAVNSLKESVKFCEDNKPDQTIHDIARDASIQRFEFCVELSWKLSKKLLGSSSATAKPVMREMLQEGLISDFQLWFEFVEARNKSSHTYDKKIAEEVYSNASKFLGEIDSLLEGLKKL